MSGLQIATGIRVAKKKKKLNPFTAVQYPPTSRDYKNVLNFFNRQVRNALCPNLFQLFGSGYTITGITECFNPGLVSAFNDKRQRLAEQQKTAPDLFKNQQWRLLSNVADREYVYNRFEQRLNCMCFFLLSSLRKSFFVEQRRIGITNHTCNSRDECCCC